MSSKFNFDDVLDFINKSNSILIQSVDNKNFSKKIF